MGLSCMPNFEPGFVRMSTTKMYGSAGHRPGCGIGANSEHVAGVSRRLGAQGHATDMPQGGEHGQGGLRIGGGTGGASGDTETHAETVLATLGGAGIAEVPKPYHRSPPIHPK